MYCYINMGNNNSQEIEKINKRLDLIDKKLDLIKEEKVYFLHHRIKKNDIHQHIIIPFDSENVHEITIEPNMILPHNSNIYLGLHGKHEYFNEQKDLCFKKIFYEPVSFNSSSLVFNIRDLYDHDDLDVIFRIAIKQDYKIV